MASGRSNPGPRVKKLHVILIRHRDLVHSFSTQARVHEVGTGHCGSPCLSPGALSTCEQVPLLSERPGDSIYLTCDTQLLAFFYFILLDTQVYFVASLCIIFVIFVCEW